MIANRTLAAVPFTALLLFGCGLALATKPTEPETVTVRSESIGASYVAYAQVEPIATLPVRAVLAGQVLSVHVTPGVSVQAGQKLAQLGGPEIQAVLTQREGAVRSARGRLAAAKRSLAAEREKLAAKLSTEQATAQAQSAVTAASSAFGDAQAQLQAAEHARMLRAPSGGVVIAVNVAQGERVAAGETLLTLQPASGLWLKAAYYGGDATAIHTGMTGEFRPASGGAVVPVVVTTVFASLATDGGEAVGLEPTAEAHSSVDATPRGWINGQSGVLTLNGARRSMVAVPTEALILDRAKWWVIVRTPQGDHRQAVVPGPVRGWETYIERGLESGQQVVVRNADLEFHQAIAQSYQPPD